MDNDTSNLPLKRCSNCGEYYPPTTEYFNPQKINKDGLTGRCKPCWKIYHADWRSKNKDKVKEYTARQKAKPITPEEKEVKKRKNSEQHKLYYIKNSERIKAKTAKFRRDNPDLARERDREYHRRNADKIKQKRKNSPPRERDREKDSEYGKRWRRENKERNKLNTQRRMARKRSLPDTMTHQQWIECLTYFNHACAVCGKPVGLWHTLAMDHWIPMNNDKCPGTVVKNIVPLCHGRGGCNNSKGVKDALEWLTSKYGKRRAGQIMKRIQAYFDSLEE